MICDHQNQFLEQQIQTHGQKLSDDNIKSYKNKYNQEDKHELWIININYE